MNARRKRERVFAAARRLGLAVAVEKEEGVSCQAALKLVRIPRFAADGSQLANAYELTPAGARRLVLGRDDGR